MTDPAADAAGEPRHAWVVVWSAFVCLAVIFGVAYSFAAFFRSFAAEFAGDRADVSLVFGLSGLIYFLLGAGAGMLADRFGPRIVCSVGMLCIAGGLFASSAARSMAAIYVAWGGGLGIGIGLVYAPAIASVPPWFVRRRAFAAGIASAGIGVGTLALPLLATSAIAALGWRHALQALAAGVVVVGVGATLLLRRAPATAAPGSTRAAGMTLREALRSRRFWWMYAACVLAAPAMFIPFAHVSAAARDLGIGDARAVGLVGMIGIGSIIGRFAIGGLADRLGRIASIALLEASLGACYLLWLAAGGYVALAVFALWLGLSYGGIVSLMPAVCMDLFGARAVSGILGTIYSGAAFGNLLGPVVAGAVFDRSGSYVAVIWACFFLASLSAIASAQLLRDTRPRY
ncbi:MAG TPA: MFS transporter [Caldimonas sp.]|nr:MFS transporter [Caldimonas sp.]HEX4236318.1 MFS transporter [Caldimonas sp.]